MSKETLKERGSELKDFFPKNGSVEIISGCMFSGKTEELIRRLKRVRIALDIHVKQGRLTREIAEEAIKAFKPSIDNRYSESDLDSHGGGKWSGYAIDREHPKKEILSVITENTKIVGIDEAQFFSPELLEVCDELASRGIRVIVAGLDTNFRGEIFGIMGDLITSSDKKDAVTAICMICGEDATRTQRIVNGKPANYGDDLIVVGAEESYEARCRKHHEVPGKPTK
ncbi:thymidine kinase [Candidatus Woesebacteria bacterium]|nr:thymidine kinase [Candidatus Woesebacteria bacterium]